MGTYTTNYNLFMPSVGEQGWGDLVNTNFSTIDTTMKSLSNSIATLETEADTVVERVTVLEAGNFETITADVGNFGEIITNGSLTFNKTTTVSFNPNATIPWYTGVMLLPPIEGNTYTGSIQVCSSNVNGTVYCTKKDGSVTSQSVKNSTLTYTIPADTVMVFIYHEPSNSKYTGWYRPIILS